MVSILDNKKTAELVIEKDSQGYEKINPESLATIIENDGRVETDTDPTVQAHINNKNIHLKMSDVIEYTGKYLTPDNVIAGDNINIVENPEDKSITISTSYVDSKNYLTPDSLVPQDTTISVTPIEDTDNKVYIRANIPDVSHFLVPSNIRAKDESISVIGEPYSNNVYIKANPVQYRAGAGLRLEDNTFINVMPDQEVILNQGSNITITGDYPEFTISAEDKLKVSEWSSSVTYQADDMVTYNNGLYKCVVMESQKAAFDPEDWEMLAGFEMTRKVISIDTVTTTVDLSMYGITQEIHDKNSVIINLAGVMQTSETYDIDPDGFTIRFIEPIPAGTLMEVIIMGNTIMDAHETTANVDDWDSYISYNVGNIVIYNHALYKCLEKHISDTAFDKTKWELIAGYVKNIYSFTTTQPTTTLTLPEPVFETSDVMVNVGNTLLLTSNYTISSDGLTLTFVEPIEEGADIEVTVLSHAVLQNSEVPSPRGRRNYMLVSNDQGDGYDLVDKNTFMTKLDLGPLADISGQGGSVVGVNDEGDSYRFYNEQELASKVQIRNTINGLYGTLLGENLIEINKGSTLDSTESLLIKLPFNMTKNISAAWERGSNKGSMLGTADNPWIQPNTTVDTEARLRVLTTEEQSDREGWRALDEYETTGNGWLANNTTAMWEYQSPYPIKIDTVRFVNQASGTLNVWSKDIDLWISNDDESSIAQKEKIIVGHFTALGEDCGETIYQIENPQYAKVFGLTILNSYGAGVGAKHIEMNGYYGSALAPTIKGYIYIISDENGNTPDIATSIYTGAEFEALLPAGFTKYALIGEFETDANANVVFNYPEMDLAKAFVTRDLVNEDRLTEVHNEIDYRITSIPGVAGYEQTVQDLRDHFDAADEALDDKIDLVNTTLDTKIDDTTALLRTDINTNTADISNANVRLTNLQNRVNTLGGHLGEFRQSIAPINDEHFHLLNGDVIDSEEYPDFHNLISSSVDAIDFTTSDTEFKEEKQWSDKSYIIGDEYGINTYPLIKNLRTYFPNESAIDFDEGYVTISAESTTDTSSNYSPVLTVYDTNWVKKLTSKLTYISVAYPDEIIIGSFPRTLSYNSTNQILIFTFAKVAYYFNTSTSKWVASKTFSSWYLMKSYANKQGLLICETDKIHFSNDGKTWTQVLTPVSGSFGEGISYFNDISFVYDATNTYMSYNGINWYIIENDYNLYFRIYDYSNGIYYFKKSYNNRTSYVHTTDFINWIEDNISYSYDDSVSYYIEPKLFDSYDGTLGVINRKVINGVIISGVVYSYESDKILDENDNLLGCILRINLLASYDGKTFVKIGDEYTIDTSSYSSDSAKQGKYTYPMLYKFNDKNILLIYTNKAYARQDRYGGTNYSKYIDLTFPENLCSDIEYQQKIQEYGCCGKFAYDGENVKYPNLANRYLQPVSIIPIYGNGKTLGLTNGVNEGSLYCAANNTTSVAGNFLNTDITTDITTPGTRPAGRWGIISNPELSGITGNISGLYDNGMITYNYVVVKE